MENKKNPIAKDLRTSKYKKRIVEDKTKYTRKEKYKEVYDRKTTD